MAKTLVIAHVSDLHVSTFGDVFQERLRLVKRSAKALTPDPTTHEVLWDEVGWRLLQDRRARRQRLTLLDPQGYAHPIPSARQDGGDADPVRRARRRARFLEKRRAVTLAAHLPGAAALEALLTETPRNTNLRLLRAAETVAAERPDVVLISGDMTDNGEGYELVEAAFRPWAERGRLLAIPGNHDLYLFPLAGSARPRATAEQKRAQWEEFARRIGLQLAPLGGFVRHFPEAHAVLVGLDSCLRPQPRFYRQNGAIGAAQLEWLREVAGTAEWRAARHRVVVLHHHVVPLAHRIGHGASTEIGMRLSDAVPVAKALNEIGCTFVLHGHRHVSEERHPAGCNYRLLAAPSLTLGCKSGDGPSFWRLELGSRAHVSRVRVPLAGVPKLTEGTGEFGDEPGESEDALRDGDGISKVTLLS